MELSLHNGISIKKKSFYTVIRKVSWYTVLTAVFSRKEQNFCSVEMLGMIPRKKNLPNGKLYQWDHRVMIDK